MTAAQRAWHWAHREEDNARRRAWYEAHREESIAKTTTYQQRNKERINARARERYAANPGKDNARGRAYYAKNREWIRAKYVLRRDRHRERDMLKKYGLTIAEYDAMFEAQGRACAMCLMPSTKRLSIDHNHVTGKVRALLCPQCNSAIGLLRDNIEGARAAVAYLEKYGAAK